MFVIQKNLAAFSFFNAKILQLKNTYCDQELQYIYPYAFLKDV